MRRALLVLTAGALALVSCGGSASAPQGPTAATVSVQQADVPSGMVRCDVSGDIDSFLSKERSSDPSTYDSTKKDWADAKAQGATAAYTAFYTDSKADCDSLKSSGGNVALATYKVIVNFVIQFKDEASATKGYTSEKIFNFSAADLKKSGQPVVEGDKTGLSPNAVTLSLAIANQSFYIAVWQNKIFMVILAAINVDAVAAKKISSSENGRIK